MKADKGRTKGQKEKKRQQSAGCLQATEESVKEAKYDIGGGEDG